MTDEAATHLYRLAYIRGAEAERARHINPDCVWGEGECVPDCPSCKRMGDLYAERVAGAMEERTRIRAALMSLVPEETVFGLNVVSREALMRVMQYVRLSEVNEALRACEERKDEEFRLQARMDYSDGCAAGARDENTRIRTGVLDYYTVAPKAAEPILRIIDKDTHG